MTNKHDPLLCTHNKCKELQTEDGEFCAKHYPREKEYTYEVCIKWVQVIPARNRTLAREQLKDTFAEEYNFTPTNKEIKLIEIK